MTHTHRSLLAFILLALACNGDAPVREAVVGLGPAVVQPPGTVAVSFVVDDSANRVYGAGDLKWKGSFLYDEATGLLAFDPYWSGALPGAPPLSGWPTLYDDGPWTAGGHEPLGARAGDHVWGVTVFVTPPAFGVDRYEYGFIDASYEIGLGNGWMWKGPNGVFEVAAGATDAIEAVGAVLPHFGNVDLELVLDTAALSPPPPGYRWDTSSVTVKSSIWGWGALAMQDRGDGTFALALRPLVGKHGVLPHTGLLDRGDTGEVVFVLGAVEYMHWVQAPEGWWYPDGAASGGVTIGVAPASSRRYTPIAIGVAQNLNLAITVPDHVDASGP